METSANGTHGRRRAEVPPQPQTYIYCGVPYDNSAVSWCFARFLCQALPDCPGTLPNHLILLGLSLLSRIVLGLSVMELRHLFVALPDCPGTLRNYRIFLGLSLIPGLSWDSRVHADCPGTLPFLPGLSQDIPVEICGIVPEMSGTPGFFWDSPKTPRLSWDTPCYSVEIFVRPCVRAFVYADGAVIFS